MAELYEKLANEFNVTVEYAQEHIRILSEQYISFHIVENWAAIIGFGLITVIGLLLTYFLADKHEDASVGAMIFTIFSGICFLVMIPVCGINLYELYNYPEVVLANWIF